MWADVRGTPLFPNTSMISGFLEVGKERKGRGEKVSLALSARAMGHSWDSVEGDQPVWEVGSCSTWGWIPCESTPPFIPFFCMFFFLWFSVRRGIFEEFAWVKPARGGGCWIFPLSLCGHD